MYLYLVGVNCYFDPATSIKTMKIMKKSMDDAGLKPHLILQPNGFWTTGLGRDGGYMLSAEYPYGKNIAYYHDILYCM